MCPKDWTPFTVRIRFFDTYVQVISKQSIRNLAQTFQRGIYPHAGGGQKTVDNSICINSCDVIYSFLKTSGGAWHVLFLKMDFKAIL